MVIDNKFSIGDNIYLVTDESQIQRVVVHIKVLPYNLLAYEVSAGTLNSSHYDFEISKEKNELIKIT